LLDILTMHGPINVKSPNNIAKWQMRFNSAFKGLTGRSKSYVPQFFSALLPDHIQNTVRGQKVLRCLLLNVLYSPVHFSILFYPLPANVENMVRKISFPPGFDSPDRPARIESLYGLSYPIPRSVRIELYNCHIFKVWNGRSGLNSPHWHGIVYSPLHSGRL
jgi:hypothetical protein